MLDLSKRVLTLPIVDRRNSLVIGATQFGKSTGVLKEIIAPTIDRGKCCVLVLDPHGSLAQAVAEYALSKGQDFRTVLVDLNNLDWVFSFGFAERPDRSLHPRHFSQQAQDTARELSEIMVTQRGPEYGGLDGKVMVKEWVMWAIQFWMHQREDLPLTMLPFAMRPGTPEFDRMLNGCTNEELKHKGFLLAGMFTPRTMGEFYKVAGPAARLIDELFSDEAFRIRAAATADLEAVVKHRGIICFKGKPNSGTTRVLLRSIWQRLVAVLKRHWLLNDEKPLPVLLVADEASTYVGDPEAQSLAETLKMMTCPETGDGGYVIITQTPDFGSDSVNVKVSQCCSFKMIFHCGGLVAPLAAAELKAGIDPGMVKRVKKKTEHTGSFQEISTKSRGKSKDHEGKERVDERDGTSFQPVYREVEEEELWGLNDQVTLTERALQRLEVGECWVRDGAEVYFLRVQKLKDPWTFPGLGKLKLAEHTRRQREQGVFRMVDSEPSLPPPPPPPPTGKKGMRKSGPS